MAKAMKALLQKAFQSPRKSIRFKLAGFFLVAAIIPLLSLGLLSYTSSSNLLHVQFSKFGQNALSQLQTYLDDQLRQMELTANYIHSYLLDPAKSVITEEIPVSYSQIQEKNNLEDFLKALNTEAHAGIFIVTRSGYYYGQNVLQTQELANESWWSDIPPTYRGQYWAGLYEPRHYSKSYGNPSRRVLGLVVPIRNQEGPLRDSRILIEMKADELYRQLKAFEQDMNASLTIRDGGGAIVYATDATEVSAMQRDDDVIWTERMEENDWTMEARVPYAQFYQSSTVIRLYTFISVGISVLLALLLAFLLSTWFTSRIKRLKESMNKASTGRLSTRIPVDSDDELGVLGRSFNHMLMHIEELVHEVTRTEQQKKEAELRAVHYQINPHLLFNTLNSIQWKARLQGNEEIRQMLYHLTMVLEGNLNIQQELVTVKRELEMIDHFLHIQRIRYGDVFRYTCEADASAMQYLIPRMSLQPLFENIFFHGFEDGEGTIVLQLREEQDKLVLTLADTGAGMSEERRRTLLSSGMPRKGRGGLGIGNVDQKFKLHFGPLYGLSIDSVHGEGTTVTIIWPKKEVESIA
ncbi:sensor histidine kinase [Paenibacillus sp. J5C_2022]|uniref:sensor histidine kinase n=1 Tax=Paenibacillus sp. J5C2022 TaxID=2977129 RepID=UPI0021CFAC75|nr:sensor histidine kinase [Paenibacillus sp. J5C2022]MCU6708407.1 sensor histidine kinase [Paenibacillus sp. J5C2022]